MNRSKLIWHVMIKLGKSHRLRKRIVYLLVVTLCAVSFTGCFRSSEARFQNWKRKGNEHYARREFEQALIAWEKARSIQPDNANIYRKMGKAYVGLARVDEAAQSFYKAIEIAPGSQASWFELGKLQLAIRNVRAAEASWEYIRKNKNDPYTYVFYGDLMVAKKELEDAVTAYRKALLLKSDLDIALVKLASCYFAQGKRDRAKSVFTAIASKNHTSSDVLFQMANYYKMADELENAEDYIVQAINAEPENLVLRNTLAEFYFEFGDYSQARTTIRKILSQAPQNRFAKKLLVEVLLSEGSMDEARSILDELALEKANDLELYLLQGKYCLFNRDAVRGQSFFKLAVEKEPNFPVGHYFLAISYLLGGQMSLAQGSLIEALTLDRDFRDAELVLADIYYKKQEFDLSFEHVRRIIEREPENFRARLIMGNILLAQGQHDKAILEFDAARVLHPESTSPKYYGAFVSQLTNDIETALHLYLSVLQQNPDLMDATMAYAIMLVEMGEAKIVESYLNEAIALSPKNAFLHHILGEIYAIIGKKKAAIACFKQAISLNSKLIVSYMGLLRIYRKGSNFKELALVLDTCIKNFPEFSEAYIQMGELYRQQGRYDEAIEILTTAINRDPESPKLANCLAWIYLEEGVSIDKAFKLAQFAYQRLPEDPAVADTLGWIYYKKNLFTQAVWLLKDALSRSPDHPIIHFHLGVTFNAMGNQKSALENLGRALALELDVAHRKEAESLYQQLQN